MLDLFVAYRVLLNGLVKSNGLLTKVHGGFFCTPSFRSGCHVKSSVLTSFLI